MRTRDLMNTWIAIAAVALVAYIALGLALFLGSGYTMVVFDHPHRPGEQVQFSLCLNPRWPQESRGSEMAHITATIECVIWLPLERMLYHWAPGRSVRILDQGTSKVSFVPIEHSEAAALYEAVLKGTPASPP